jgi:capsular polysaccharide transport system permease protein
MIKLLQAQMRIIGAIGVREINAQQANLMYGYVWALVDAALAVLGLLVMKLVLRAFNPPGLPAATFILSGALPWFMWMALYASPAMSISRNRKLLSFPIVTELDLIIGGSLQVVITYTVVLVFMTAISSWWEVVPPPRFPLGLLLLMLAIWAMGLSFGMFLMLVNRIYAPAAKFIAFFLRFALFLCGVYIPITKFPSYIWPYLTWMPMLHVEELLRQYWFYNYVSPVGNPIYVLECVMGMIAVGLLCERYARVRLPIP